MNSNSNQISRDENNKVQDEKYTGINSTLDTAEEKKISEL